jgi:hypothetical protein
MKKKTIFVTMLLVCALSTAVIYNARAQTPSVLGLKAGDNFTYSFEVIWTSTDPTQSVPQEFSDMNHTISIHVNVTDVGGTMAYVTITNVMTDGSSPSSQGFIDISSGRGVGAQLLVIGANLTAGDQAYPQSDAAAVTAGAAAAPFTISDTLNKTYLGALKMTNHYYERVTNSTTGDYIDRSAYYDRGTGVMLEMTLQHYYASLGETDTEHWMITQFNNAVAGPSDGGSNNGSTSNSGLQYWLTVAAIAVAVVIVAVLAVIVMLRRKKQAQAPPPASIPAAPQTSA